MSAQRDVRKLHEGLHKLGDAALRRLAAPTRTMVQPLVAAIEEAGQTGNDRADLKALRDRLPAIFAEMDDAAIADKVESALMQTYAVSRTAAVPDGFEASDFATEPESLKDTLEATP